MSHVIDLVGEGNNGFHLPKAEVAKRFIAPFILIKRPLDKDTLTLLISCDDFDCIENVGLDVNNERTCQVAFYKD